MVSLLNKNSPLLYFYVSHVFQISRGKRTFLNREEKIFILIGFQQDTLFFFTLLQKERWISIEIRSYHSGLIVGVVHYL